MYRRLNDYNLSYVMLMRQLADLTGTPLEHLQGDSVLQHFRSFYSGNLMLNAGIAPSHGEELLRQGLGEMIAFGREYIANPDYGATAEGYTDYATLAQLQEEAACA